MCLIDTAEAKIRSHPNGMCNLMETGTLSMDSQIVMRNAKTIKRVMCDGEGMKGSSDWMRKCMLSATCMNRRSY